MSELTKPCQNCGVGVDVEIWAEELGFCVPCQEEFFDHLPEGACGHFVRECPNGLDCSPFCALCEGSGDFCRVCSADVHIFGVVCVGRFCSVCSLGEVKA